MNASRESESSPWKVCSEMVSMTPMNPVGSARSLPAGSSGRGAVETQQADGVRGVNMHAAQGTGEGPLAREQYTPFPPGLGSQHVEQRVPRHGPAQARPLTRHGGGHQHGHEEDGERAPSSLHDGCCIEERRRRQGVVSRLWGAWPVPAPGDVVVLPGGGENSEGGMFSAARYVGALIFCHALFEAPSLYRIRAWGFAMAR